MPKLWKKSVYEKYINQYIGKEEAIKELKKCSGTQFDSEIVKCFIDHIEDKKI